METTKDAFYVKVIRQNARIAIDVRRAALERGVQRLPWRRRAYNDL